MGGGAPKAQDAHPMKAKRDVRVEHLRRVPLFEGCSDADLARIARASDEIAVPTGYVLVHEGDWGEEAFVIADGEAEVAVDGRQLAVLGPGSVVGEMAVLDGGPRTATVAAVTPLRLFAFDSSVFTTLLDNVPLVARRVLSGMSHRLRAAQGAPV